MKRTIGIILVVLAGIVLLQSIYVVEETEQTLKLQFGKAVGKTITEPGLNFKLPFIQTVKYFPKNLLEWDGEKGQVPTKDKTYIWVDVFARWRISDALRFYQNLNNETNAQSKLDDIIDPAVRNLVTSHMLIEAVRNTNRSMDLSESGVDERTDVITKELELGRSAMCDAILRQAQPKLADFGVELVDVRFKRINYVDEVLKNVYERMIAERRQIAEKYRSEGRGESQRIEGEREKELKKIRSEAYRKAQEIKGEADAGAAAIYARAYGKEPEFYSFVKTLDIYRQSIDTSSTAVFSTESDFLKYLKSYKPAR
jgi:membrane protease subunit HflC